MKINCWDAKKCGRQKGGAKAAELGVCPAALPSKFDGLNGGRMGGRYCWKIAGTLCGGEVQGSYADKLTSCVKCDFFKAVKAEEGPAFQA